MQDDIHSSRKPTAALIATAMLEASRCRHGCVGLLMAVFYAFVLEPILSAPALVKGLVYALLVWLANTSSCSHRSAKAHSLSMWQNSRLRKTPALTTCDVVILTGGYWSPGRINAKVECAYYTAREA
jgi:hypothetical protein